MHLVSKQKQRKKAPQPLNHQQHWIATTGTEVPEDSRRQPKWGVLGDDLGASETGYLPAWRPRWALGSVHDEAHGGPAGCRECENTTVYNLSSWWTWPWRRCHVSAYHSPRVLSSSLTAVRRPYRHRPRGSTSPATPAGQRRPLPWASLPASPVLGLIYDAFRFPPATRVQRRTGLKLAEEHGPLTGNACLLCALLGPGKGATLLGRRPIAMNDVSQRAPGWLVHVRGRSPRARCSWLSESCDFFFNYSKTCPYDYNGKK